MPLLIETIITDESNNSYLDHDECRFTGSIELFHLNLCFMCQPRCGSANRCELKKKDINSAELLIERIYGRNNI